MNLQRRCLQTGAAAIALAILLRLIAGGALGSLLKVLTGPTAVSIILFLETGRVVRTTPPVDTLGESTLPDPIPTEQGQPLTTQAAVFGATDATLVKVNSVCGLQTDVPAWLESDLQWNLRTQAPTVLIVHSHGTESYTPDGNYTESSAYRTKDTEYNVVSVGDRLVQILEAKGIGVVHDRTLHDSPSYNDAYYNARTSIQSYLDQYPTIQMVLDLHRDAVEDQGQQMDFTVDTEEGPVAQLMLVVGSNAGGLAHPDWPENMSLAVKIHAQLEKEQPGICRAISFRSQRFNQDLSPGALIIEVGGTGNTRQEALAAVEILGEAIGKLSLGANLTPSQ